MKIRTLGVFLAAVMLSGVPAVAENHWAGFGGGNGIYSVSALAADEWVWVGDLAYGSHFETKSLDLRPYAMAGRELNVRIRQEGGGAAHIDSVLYDGAPPVGAVDRETELHKLVKSDSDVLDSFGRTLELTFPAREGWELRLAARVEGARVSDTPFQFPLSNLHRAMDRDADFLEYELGSGSQEPLFREYCVTGTGHPFGFTYGWVRNDAENLYVRIDFTPDNTMDGGKDYAAVYVRTGKEVKEFRVSTLQTTWGTPLFTYTETVPYEHKV